MSWIVTAVAEEGCEFTAKVAGGVYDSFDHRAIPILGVTNEDIARHSPAILFIVIWTAVANIIRTESSVFVVVTVVAVVINISGHVVLLLGV